MAFEGEDARRWAVVDAPPLQPAVDFITKSPNGPFIDTGINIAFETRGRVYLSIDTIREMAEIIGVLESKDNAAKAVYDEEVYNRGYEAGLKEGEELVRKLMGIAGRLAVGDSSDVVTGVETVESDEGIAGSESGKSDGDSDNVQSAPVGKRKSGGKTSSASSSSGPDDIPSPSDDNAAFRI